MVIPPLYAQVNYIFSGEGYKRGAQVAIGVANPEELDPVVLAASAQVAWTTTLLQHQSEEIQLAAVKVKHGPNIDGPEYTQVVAEDGLVEGAGLPPNVALLVVKRAIAGGRKNRGRMFVPGLSESDQDSAGYLTTAKLATWQTSVEGFLVSLSEGTIPMVLLHNDETPPTDVASLEVQSLFATQKRRIRRAGGRRKAAEPA